MFTKWRPVMSESHERQIGHLETYGHIIIHQLLIELADPKFPNVKSVLNNIKYLWCHMNIYVLFFISTVCILYTLSVVQFMTSSECQNDAITTLF